VSDAFQCRRCGACCRVPGYVHVSDAEVAAIAGHLGMGLAEFTAQYTRLTATRSGLSLTEGTRGACAFLAEDASCAIEAVKPRQCREFPELWRFRDYELICQAAARPQPAGERKNED
jgi:uncharacterized protein